MKSTTHPSTITMNGLFLYTVPIVLNEENYDDNKAPFSTDNTYRVSVIAQGDDKWEEVKDIIRQKSADTHIAGPYSSFKLSKVSDADIEWSLQRVGDVKVTPLNSGVITFSAIDG